MSQKITENQRIGFLPHSHEKYTSVSTFKLTNSNRKQVSAYVIHKKFLVDMVKFIFAENTDSKNNLLINNLNVSLLFPPDTS